MKMNKIAGLSLACSTLLMSCLNQNDVPVVVTDYKCQVQAKDSNSPVGEEVVNVVDGDIYSKFLTFTSSASLELTPVKRSRLNSYTLVSGNDEPLRDPASWTLEGSRDGQTWELLDTQSDITFLERNQSQEFQLVTEETFAHYRFHLATNGHDILQLSEIKLNGVWDRNDKHPIAQFKADQTAFFDKGTVQFQNLSVQGDTYQWYFKGGEPATSTEANPTINYAAHGKYPVKLVTVNNQLADTAFYDAFVNVKRLGGWEHFEYPHINFVNTTLGGNGDLYQELVPAPIDLINKVSLDVCQKLYRSVDEVNVLKILDYSIEDIETISAKGGNPPHINIFFSSSYLKNKKGELSDEELIAEIVGVLYHELTHGYQYAPKGAGGYQRGADYFGLIEGVADYVRLNAGYSSYDYRKVGGHWNDGYKTTAFFIDWLHTKDPDFVYKLNQSAQTIIPWSWEAACQSILSASVEDLWNEYQNYLKTQESI
jgi:PKD repeat protein